MSQTSLVYMNEKHLKTQPRPLEFRLQITAAKTVTLVPVGADCLVAFDALSQAAIDAYLGTASEFLAAALDATALGANELALLVKMNGQCAKLVGAKAEYWTADGATVVAVSSAAASALTASTAKNECAVGSDGNIAVKFKDLGGIDAATDGQILVTLYWVAK
mgnify:CR=1 FL=1